ncbi:MAG: response regulator transcription factor [Saprospiraceae bacterium]|nr:response regulator transcription factor [Saprospiraceae bacterium]
MTEKITILLADDHRSYVEGLTALFQNDELLYFLGHVHQPGEVAGAVGRLQPQVVLMDYSFGEGQPDGVETAVEVLRDFPNLKIILLTSYDDAPIVQSALSKGIAGFLLKARSRAEIKKAIEAVAAGFEVVEGGMLRHILEKNNHRTRPEVDGMPDQASPLTPRELEIALLVAEGLSTQAISERLFRSANTIDTHRKNIFSKLDVHNVAELMNWLRARQLV